jgi:hypothetical protein
MLPGVGEEFCGSSGQEFCCSRVREGFRVGYDYRRAKCVSAKGNTRSVAQHREVVDAYVQSETSGC